MEVTSNWAQTGGLHKGAELVVTAIRSASSCARPRFLLERVDNGRVCAGALGRYAAGRGARLHIRWEPLAGVVRIHARARVRAHISSALAGTSNVPPPLCPGSLQ